MRRRLPIVLAISFLAGAVVPAQSEAHVVRFVVEETRPFAGGMSFGTTGPYERLDERCTWKWTRMTLCMRFSSISIRPPETLGGGCPVSC